MIDYENIAVMGRLSYEGRPFFLRDKGSKDDRLIFEVLRKKGYEMNEMYSFPNGLTVLVFESDKDVYICFRGTDFTSPRDWATNLQIYVGKRLPGQFKSALRFVEKFECYKGTGKKIYVVGHSLGGAVASYIAQELSFSVDGIITINGCGIAHLGLQRRSEQCVTHLINSHDWLNKYMRWIVGFGRKLDQIEGRTITFKDNKYNSILKAHGDWSVFMRGEVISDEYNGAKEK